MSTKLNGLIATSLTSLSLLLAESMSFAQGAVQFANNPLDLISYGAIGSESVLPASEPGAFYFALLISTNPAGPFTFTGVYATNDATAGRIGPVTSPTVPNWPICNDRFYEIAGWSSNLGAVWNPGWLVNNLPAPGLDPIWSGVPTNSYFGLSSIASGAASGPGEFCGPVFPLFGGAGLKGFNLAPVVRQLVLSASNSGGNVVVSWIPSGGTLQSSPVVGPGATWATVGTQNPINVPVSSGAKFFRVVP